MEKVPYANETDRFVHVGGTMIPPRDTREVDPRLLPGYRTEAPSSGEATGPANPLVLILAAPVKQVTAGLAALSDDELAELLALEEGGVKPRSSLVSAITAEQLRRASERQGVGDTGGGEGGEDDSGEGGAGGTDGAGA